MLCDRSWLLFPPVVVQEVAFRPENSCLVETARWGGPVIWSLIELIGWQSMSHEDASRRAFFPVFVVAHLFKIARNGVSPGNRQIRRLKLRKTFTTYLLNWFETEPPSQFS